LNAKIWAAACENVPSVSVKTKGGVSNASNFDLATDPDRGVHRCRDIRGRRRPHRLQPADDDWDPGIRRQQSRRQLHRIRHQLRRPADRYDYVADRSNASVDIINGATLNVVAQAGGFTGQKATTSVSGPDGVLVADNGTTATLFAGNGSSTLLSFNVTNPAMPSPLFSPISTFGAFRVDEMAYSPTSNLVLAANNADSPAFATLVNASTGAIVKGNITIPGTNSNSGLEQSVWDPKTGTFFVSVPAFAGTNDPGGVAEIDVNGNVIQTYHFASLSGGSITSCSPAGIALGASGNLLVGCGNAKTQTVLLNPNANAGTGAIVATFAGIAGSDELYYDPSTGDYFVTGSDATGNNRIFGVISDATDTLIQTVALPDVNAHSISVDPLNGDVFVPLEGSIVGGLQDPLCPGGCIAVFAQNVPEPASSLPLLAFALLGTAGASTMIRRFSHLQ
jgi:hypothetical protein